MTERERERERGRGAWEDTLPHCKSPLNSAEIRRAKGCCEIAREGRPMFIARYALLKVER